jgi:hypothetical protein
MKKKIIRFSIAFLLISNLANDIHKLDLGLQIIRKLISQLDNVGHFPWVVKDITTSLLELNQIIDKNYALRDSYYSMEKNIPKPKCPHGRSNTSCFDCGGRRACVHNREKYYLIDVQI